MYCGTEARVTCDVGGIAQALGVDASELERAMRQAGADSADVERIASMQLDGYVADRVEDDFGLADVLRDALAELDVTVPER